MEKSEVVEEEIIETGCYYHPYRNMRNVWMKTEKNRKQDIKEYFENIYKENWYAPFMLMTNTLGERFLLIDWHTYASIKEQTEKILRLELPEVSPIEEFTNSILQPRHFSSCDEMQGFVEEMYTANRKIRLELLFKQGTEELEVAENIMNGGKGQLLALDVESWEFNGKYILEVGVTLFCVADKDVIATRHFILEENQDKRNGKHCADNRDNFEFGKSELKPTQEIVQIINQMMQGVVLCIFHNATAELNYLKRLEIPVTAPVIDTQCISYLFPDRNGRRIGLEPLLQELEIPVSKMHNAGNDSHCTMLALLALLRKFKESPLN